jgi:hypothetical protein
VPKSLDVDLALITCDTELWRDVALPLVKTAQPPDAQTLYLRQTVPGIGKLLSLVLRYASPQIDRVPRGPEVASYCRLVTCAQESAGKRSSTSGSKIGQARLPWAAPPPSLPLPGARCTFLLSCDEDGTRAPRCF